MNEDDIEFGRDYLIELLNNNIVTIEFTKKNGEFRKMDCTLMEEVLPPRVVNEDKPKKKVNLDILSVWDVEKRAWRAFRVDSVTAFQFSI